MGARLFLAGVAAVAAATLALSAAPAAMADASASTNWAGYAIHRGGVRFNKVLGQWTQPRVTCTAGDPTYSAVWVGIGGYARSSRALEQIGTEIDCNSRGRTVSSSWYELVPSASHTTSLIVHAGDRIRASVAVSGHEVTLLLDDKTRHRSFTKTMRAPLLDISSAEWIVEAPSVCTSEISCQTLPLANFSSARITSATAKSTRGHSGGIKDRHWGVSEISLLTPEPRFVAQNGGTGASAVPSPLSRKGNAFTVTYRGGSAGTPTATPASVTDARLVHPRR
ncbi:MAG: G1 family glutamic endopeptidase [Solirubrobacteraceae bacterium]